ncbi:hypothetical protein [Dictyobacter kobayashii]|uniref:Uncharacterized protein n=1 Tax=Dictyobacter kobayashii TaxID=2014872 RepID=A0A402ALD3_9CHLR|nr:hypothetical protein [Dictyobacter kobayashii]GCE19845.1 hypothetical protein KDK_36450 [Dictyobacter kobayashii]
MDQNKEKLEKVNVEPISAQEKQHEKKEIMDAAKRASKGASAKSSAGDELDGVETISREQAMDEMRKAAQKVKNANKRQA